MQLRTLGCGWVWIARATNRLRVHNVTKYTGENVRSGPVLIGSNGLLSLHGYYEPTAVVFKTFNERANFLTAPETRGRSNRVFLKPLLFDYQFHLRSS